MLPIDTDACWLDASRMIESKSIDVCIFIRQFFIYINGGTTLVQSRPVAPVTTIAISVHILHT